MSASENQGATTTVGAALAEGLARAGVKIAFTVPGESVLGLIEELSANRIRVVAARHEGGAAFMAAAVGQLTGRPAVVIATRGPGATNMAIGLHAARADSAPVIAIVGGVKRAVQGREAFQELDAVRAFEPIVKFAGEVKDEADALPMLERAVTAATRGRPGPALISIAADLLDSTLPAGAQNHLPAAHQDHPTEPDPVMVRKVLHVLGDARRPLILAGAGVLRARSSDALVRFAETMRVPVVSSWRRGDVFPNDHPLYLGMTGLGAPACVRARLEEADGLLVLGCRLGEMTTFGYRIPGPATRWALVDIEPRGGSASHRPETVLAADAAAFLRMAQRVLARAAFEASSFDERTAANAVDRAAYEAGTVVDAEPWDGTGVHPGRVVATLARVLPPEAIVTTDAGDFGTWAARGLRFHRPGTFLGSSAGPMGYGLPAAVGATLARPGRLGVALAGDGGFAMTMAELETAVRERAHVIAVVFDNGRYGTIWRHQQERGRAVGLGTRLGPVDFAAVAEAAGALGLSVRNDEEFEPALREALAAGRPAVLHLAMDPGWSTVEVGRVELAASELAGPSEASEAPYESAPPEGLATGEGTGLEPDAGVGPDLEPEVQPDVEPEVQPDVESENQPEIEPAEAADSGSTGLAGEAVETLRVPAVDDATPDTTQDVAPMEDAVAEPEPAEPVKPDAADAAAGEEPALGLTEDKAEAEPATETETEA
jgi:acetolactate synthase I/II/III large subunit